MNIPLVVFVVLILSAIALACYMDWLGLWVTKEEINYLLADSRMRKEELEKHTAGTRVEPSVRASEATSIPAAESRIGTPV